MASGTDILERFKSALETYENLLHAETQAIAAKHLDTIEEVLEQKEISLAVLLETRDKLGSYDDDMDLVNRVERILGLQERNAVSFKKFFKERSRKEKGLENKLSSGDYKLRQIYLNS